MSKEQYKYFPKTKDELRSLIGQRIKDEGNAVNLNDIDVSKITDMSWLFEHTDFSGDISNWDVSKVTDMNGMFYRCESFNQNISDWDVSKVTNMKYMFCWCKSFNQDLSDWDVSNVTDMGYMFCNCKSFNQDISSWNVSNVIYNNKIFENCQIKEEYKPKFIQITMTKEKAKHLAEVLNAYAEGKPIEVLLDGEWGEVDLNEYSFDENESYRIKKEPKYRPFKNAKECFDEMKKHQPFGWLRNNKDFSIITAFNNKVIEFQHSNYDFEDILIHGITFADGQPFGIKE